MKKNEIIANLKQIQEAMTMLPGNTEAQITMKTVVLNMVEMALQEKKPQMELTFKALKRNAMYVLSNW